MFQNVRQISIIKLSIIAVEVIDNIFNNITHEYLVATRPFWKGLAKTIATPSVRACERQTRTPGISILTYPSQANFIWRVYVRARATVFRDTANMIMHARALPKTISVVRAAQSDFGNNIRKRMPTVLAMRPTTVNPMTGIYSELQAVIKRTLNPLARGAARSDA